MSSLRRDECQTVTASVVSSRRLEAIRCVSVFLRRGPLERQWRRVVRRAESARLDRGERLPPSRRTRRRARLGTRRVADRRVCDRRALPDLRPPESYDRRCDTACSCDRSRRLREKRFRATPPGIGQRRWFASLAIGVAARARSSSRSTSIVSATRSVVILYTTTVHCLRPW